MTKWAHADTLDAGPKSIDDLAAADSVEYWLLKAYSAGDSFATASGNKVAATALTGANITLSSSSSNRVMTVAGVDDVPVVAASGASPDLHLALIDIDASKVLFVTDETTNVVLTTDNTVDLPSFSWTVAQPT